MFGPSIRPRQNMRRNISQLCSTITEVQLNNPSAANEASDCSLTQSQKLFKQAHSLASSIEVPPRAKVNRIMLAGALVVNEAQPHAYMSTHQLQGSRICLAWSG